MSSANWIVLLALFAGALAGGALTWLFLRGRNALAVERARGAVLEELATLKERLSAERRSSQEKLVLLEGARDELSNAFKALSSDALQSNNESFLQLARQTFEGLRQSSANDLARRQEAVERLVEPIAVTLGQVDAKLVELEKDRASSMAGIREHLRGVAEAQQELRREAANLVKALGTPRIRGRWGEIQLRRVVELAGMIEKCDFFEQESVESEGRRLRPDLIVRLPGGKNVVIDAKTPLSGYLEAMEATTEVERVSRLKDHARLVRDRIAELAQKSYWDQFQPAPEFVVLFLPGESFFSAALEQDPALIELGAEVKVVLATPTTLIALLKAVAYGWRQEAIAENARLIASLGEELHRRLATLAGHFTRLGKQLSEAVGAYNQAVGSLESRVLVTGRRFKELGLGAGAEIPQPEPVLEETRRLSASELTAAAEDTGSGEVPRPGDVFPTAR